MRFFALLPLLLLLAAPASAGIYLEVVGDNQGQILGESTFTPEVDNIILASFSHTLNVPYDPSTGQPAGPPQHAPLIVNKERDSATNGLLTAMTTVENLTVTLRLYTTGGQGPMLYYSIKLVNAKLVFMTQGGDGMTPPIESWSFVYREITWTDELANTSTTDTWVGGLLAVDLNDGTQKLPLSMPRPNPMASQTLLSFELPLATEASLDVYDVRGRRVRSLYWGATPTQQMAVTWDGRDDYGDSVAKGMYIVQLKWPKGEVTRRVTLVD